MVQQCADEHDHEQHHGADRRGSLQFCATTCCAGYRARAQVAEDSYNFEFLGLSGEVAERDLENALTSRITETLRELGPGFAFVGPDPLPGVRAEMRRCSPT
ncbi:DUF1016 domain-containing protein [Arthrobacter sp. AFG20]|uniref:DUF1016 domain-containing protein n=1 Tax=Arthrobacter sp. AFG20 TaxID=1688671 RepID=UPI002155E7A3|nr:DUF1016 domain-containing protein [Arthrobacter sp. AFG20]